jgi:hypothetical protein
MQSKQQAIRNVRQEAHASWSDMKEKVIQLQNENSMLMSFAVGGPSPHVSPGSMSFLPHNDDCGCD